MRHLKMLGSCIFCALVLASTMAVLPAHAYILCNREADIIPVNATPDLPDDSCTGSVMLQGIRYQCGPLSEVDSRRGQYLEELRTKGAQFCEDYCSKRGGWLWHKCHGHFSAPQQCGFTVSSDLAEAYGREMASCDPRCGGIAFTYCSIYHAGVLQVDPKLLASAVPNCSCRP